MRRTSAFLLSILVTAIIGCSSSAPTPSAESPMAGDELVLMWSVPKDGLDGYVLNYGYSPEKLEFSTRVTKEELERIDHPQFGPVFRYSLKGLSSNRPVYVTLSAVNGETVSAPSQVMEVQPR